MSTNLSTVLGRLTADQKATVTFESGFNADLSVATSSYAATFDNVPLFGPQIDTVQSGSLQTGGTITYGFYNGDPYFWSDAAKQNIEQALALWSGMAGITFVLTDAADAAINFVHDGDTYKGVSYAPSDPVNGGTAFVNLGDQGTGIANLRQTTAGVIHIDTTTGGFGDITSYTTADGYGIDVLVHEIGHLVGLGHTGPYNAGVQPAAPNQNNSTDVRTWSVMSYIDPNAAAPVSAATTTSENDAMGRYAGSYEPQGLNWNLADGGHGTPLTPMGLDIIAAQRLLGAPGSLMFEGFQTFGFNSTIRYTAPDGTTPLLSMYDFNTDAKPIVTLYDWGSHNTLDLSLFTDDARVDLNDGQWSDVAGLKDNIFIEWGTQIDTAIGGGGNDSFTANHRSDTFDGRGGINTVTLDHIRGDYDVSRGGGALILTDAAAQETETLKNIQTLVFSDGASVDTASITTITWTGSKDTHYDHFQNWDSGAVPTANDDVIIPGGFTVDVTQEATNTVDSVQLAGTSVLNVNTGHFIVTDAGEVSLNAGTINVGNDQALGTTLYIQGSFDNAGRIFLGGPGAQIQTMGGTTTLNGFGDLTMLLADIGGSAPGVGGTGTLDTLINLDNTIHGSGVIGQGAGFLFPLFFVNSGTVNADDVVAPLTLGSGAVNHAVLIGSQAGGLVLEGIVNNSDGSIESENSRGSVQFDNSDVEGGLIESTGGSLDVTGKSTLDGTSTPVTLNGTLVVDSIGTLTLKGAITGGTIDTSAGIVLIDGASLAGLDLIGGPQHIFYIGNSNALTGSTALENGLPIAAGQLITFGGSFTNPQTIALNGTGGKGATMALGGSVSFAGGGKITLSNAADRIAASTPFAEFENVDNTIQGTGILSGLYLLQNDSAGTIEAKGGALILNATSIDNQGTMEADAGGTLELLGTLNGEFGGTLAGPGVIALGGMLDGAGVVGGLASFTLAAGTTITVDAPGATLTTVQNNGSIVVNGDATLTVEDTLTNTGTVLLSGTPGHLATLAGTSGGFSGGELRGGGTIVVGAEGVLNGATLVNVDNIIIGDGFIGGDNFRFENSFSGGAYGTVDADVAGGTMTVDATTGTLFNGSLMEATNGGTLEIDGLLQNYVTLDFIIPVERNGAGVLRAVGAGSVVLLNSATIAEGGLDSTGGGSVQVVGSSTLLVGDGLIPIPGEALPYARNSAFSTSADMRVAAGATLVVATDTLQSQPTNTQLLNNYGSITVAGTLLVSMSYLDLTSGGTVTLSGAGAAILGENSADTLLNQDTIAGSGALGVGFLQLTNDVMVEATDAAAPLVVESAGNFANHGTLASAGGTLVLLGAIVSGGEGVGQIAGLGGGAVQLGGLDHNGVAQAGVLRGNTILRGALVHSSDAGGTLDSSTLAGGFPLQVFNEGTVQVAPGQSLTIAGTMQNTGVYDIVAGSFELAGSIELQGAASTLILGSATVDLTGFGGQVLLDNAADRIDGIAGQTFVSDSNTITGAGHIGSGQIGFSNAAGESLLNATGALEIDTATPVSNAGQLEATGGGRLEIVSGVDNSSLIKASVGSSVVLDGDVTGTGTLQIFGGLLALGGSVASTQTVSFSGFLDESLALAVPLQMAGTIGGFGFSETIDLKLTQATTLSFDAGVLHVRDGSTEVAALAMSGSYSSSDFKLVGDRNGGTEVVSSLNPIVSCFAAGTRLLTARGEIAVEALREGDVMITVDGGRLAPVVWIGHTDIDLERHPDPARVAPITVAAAAFAPGVPHRDLVLSPDHAVYLGGDTASGGPGVLIQIQALVNGATISRAVPQGRIRYYHVELACHAVLLAEGLPAESYLDTGNRSSFANSGLPQRLHADLEGARGWDSAACAPLLLGGPVLADWHRRLAARATAGGHALTDDPAVQVLAGGAALAPVEAAPGGLSVNLPPGTTRVTLQSRSAVPAEIDRTEDRRRLGIPLLSITLDGVPVALEGGPGLHPAEHDGVRHWQWTDGEAKLVLPPCDRPAVLTLVWGIGWQCYRTAPTLTLSSPARAPGR